MTDADAVVVGTGPGGATAAHVLSAAGWSVIMLDKGRNHLLALDPPFAPLGHLSNDELKLTVRSFLGPDPIAEPRTFRRRAEDGDRTWVGAVNNLPSTVGVEAAAERLIGVAGDGAGNPFAARRPRWSASRRTCRGPAASGSRPTATRRRGSRPRRRRRR